MLSYPRGGKALRGAFSRFQPKDTIQWFNQRGVQLKTEADGRMFPVTDDSATIVNCLERAAQQAGVRIKTRSPISRIEKSNNKFQLWLKSETVECDRLLLTTGSSPAGHRIAQSLGHTIDSPVPSLFTFNISDKRLHQLSGVAVDPVVLKLKIENVEDNAGARKKAASLTQTGPLLVTHWGISGPAVLKLSAWGARELQQTKYRAQLIVNWLPGMTQEQVRTELQTTKVNCSRRAIATHSPYAAISKRLWQYLLSRIDIDNSLTWANLSKKQLNQLVELLTQSSYDVMGKSAFKDEFVTCGGVQLKEVNFKTMESRQCPGLYLSGEILNIDGITGGFNFQSAWTTGWLAGCAIASSN